MNLDLFGDTLAPAADLVPWLQRVGYEPAAELLTALDLTPLEQQAAALLRESWQARCRGEDGARVLAMLQAAMGVLR